MGHLMASATAGQWVSLCVYSVVNGLRLLDHLARVDSGLVYWVQLGVWHVPASAWDIVVVSQSMWLVINTQGQCAIH